MKQRIAWTQAEEEVLRKMAAAGHDLDAVVQVLKSRGKEAVRIKAGNIGVLFRSAQPEIDMSLYTALMGGGVESV